MASGYTRIEQAKAASLTALADILAFRPVHPTRVLRWGVVITTAPTVTAPVVKADIQKVAGTRGNGDGGQMTIPVAQAIGSVLNNELKAAGALVTAAPIDMNPGDALFLEVTTAATAGVGDAWIEYEERGFNKTATNVTEKTN